MVFKKFFHEHYQSVKWFGSRSGTKFCPVFGPNCLERLSADDRSRHSKIKSYGKITQYENKLADICAQIYLKKSCPILNL